MEIELELYLAQQINFRGLDYKVSLHSEHEGIQKFIIPTIDANPIFLDFNECKSKPILTIHYSRFRDHITYIFQQTGYKFPQELIDLFRDDYIELNSKFYSVLKANPEIENYLEGLEKEIGILNHFKGAEIYDLKLSTESDPTENDIGTLCEIAQTISKNCKGITWNPYKECFNNYDVNYLVSLFEESELEGIDIYQESFIPRDLN